MKARILVVDDDAALAEMIGIVLSSEGFEPVFCYDGSAAEETFRSVAPDLVLLDLMLPGMDGIQVCETIRQTSDIPIVMLTAKSDTADVVRGLEAGADDYVPKPFKPAELVARVKARLRPIERGATQEITLGMSELCRMVWHTWMPSIPGSMRSSRTRSGSVDRNVSSAAEPS